MQLQGTRAKIERGKQHINELETSIEQYLLGNPIITVGYEKRHAGLCQFEMRSLTVTALPNSLVMIFGDAVHNIRASLDWMINEVVASRTSPTADLSFPFSSRAEGLGRAIREKMKDTSSAERQIVRELKPYRGGNDDLWALHELDIRDKHRAPLAVATTVTSSSMVVRGLPSAPELQQTGKFSPIPDEYLHHFVPDAGFTSLGVMQDAMREVVIADNLPLHGRNAVSALTGLADMVEAIVQRFEALS